MQRRQFLHLLAAPVCRCPTPPEGYSVGFGTVTRVMGGVGGYQVGGITLTPTPETAGAQRLADLEGRGCELRMVPR